MSQTPVAPADAAPVAASQPTTAPTVARSNAATPPLLELRSVSKSFPGVQALHDVSIAVRPGEVLGIVGENGAGKSTLLKILGGILRCDAGQMLVDGEARSFRGVRDALAAGIGLIHQELNLAPALSVAENLFLGRQPTRGPRWLPLTDRPRLYRDAARELKRVGLAVSPRQQLGQLDIARQQLVEIAKALATQARILIFDEPTSSLSVAEANRLLAIIDDLRRRGVAVIYVSHRLGEVRQIADRVVVLRDGKHVGTLSRGEATHDRMISLMVGRDLQPSPQRESFVARDAPRLAVRELRLQATSPPVSFEIYPGEIVGFAGIVGAGRTEVAEALFGIARPASGRIIVDGREVRIKHPLHAKQAGLALVPEDRQRQGVIARLAMRTNVTLSVLGDLGRRPWYNRPAERRLAERFRQELQIRSTSVDAPVASFSGGNQQKVVLAKWLATQPRALILDEPTRGVDVGAKQEIYRMIHDLARRGLGVMLISSEMEEIIGVSDRVLVMRQGQIAGELRGDSITEENIMQLAVGVAAPERGGSLA